ADAGAAAPARDRSRRAGRIRGIAGATLVFLVIAGVLCPPGRKHRLRGIPSGWSRVVPLAERRPHTGAGTPSRAGCSGGVVISAVRRLTPCAVPRPQPRDGARRRRGQLFSTSRTLRMPGWPPCIAPLTSPPLLRWPGAWHPHPHRTAIAVVPLEV